MTMATMILRMTTVFCAAVLGSMACTPATVVIPPSSYASSEPVVVVGNAPWVLAALPAARDRLRDFGLELRLTTTITVHANVDSFIAATGQTDGNLRAWTTFHEVHLLDRWTWHNTDDTHTRARITHELCHAALYQALGADEAAARAARPPSKKGCARWWPIKAAPACRWLSCRRGGVNMPMSMCGMQRLFMTTPMPPMAPPMRGLKAYMNMAIASH
jgi:hypothetical protein